MARFDNDQQRDLYWQLNYMLGRYKYRNRQFEEAIRLFQKVDRRSEYYVKSQFFTGISYVQVRKSIPAVQAFQRIQKALDEGVEGVEDESRLRDLASLSMARTYYSSSIKTDAETNQPTVDSTKLSAAVKYWNQVDVASEYWLDALFEESWAYFMAGDYPHALGNIHTLQSPYFPNSFYPEASVLKAVIYFSNLQLRGGHHRRRSVQQEVHADQGAAGEGAQELQGREQGRAVLQILARGSLGGRAIWTNAFVRSSKMR